MRNLIILLLWALFSILIYVTAPRIEPTILNLTPGPPMITEVTKPPATGAPLTEPPKEYVDPSKGGTFGPGDNVTVLGEKGKIAVGQIKEGKVISSTLVIEDKESQPLLIYEQVDDPDHGHLELISYLQQGYVVIRQNGKKIGVCLNYYDEYNFSDYVAVVFEPQTVNPDLESKLLC